MTGYVDVSCRTADGLVLHARDYAGPPSQLCPVLCLPGLTRNARDFDHVAERLALNRRIIVAEQRGRGRSDWDPDPARYQPITYVQDMIALIDQLGIARVVVVGTSLGGLMAMLMAATAKARLAGAVLNDVGPQVSPEGIGRIRTYLGREVRIRNWADAAADIRTVFGDAFPDYDDADWERAARALYREGADGIPVVDYDPAITANLSKGPQLDLWPVFELMKPLPVMVVRGALSDLLSAATVRQMAERHPGLVAIEVPRRGHAPTLEEPEAVVALDAFLATVA